MTTFAKLESDELADLHEAALRALSRLDIPEQHSLTTAQLTATQLLDQLDNYLVQELSDRSLSNPTTNLVGNPSEQIEDLAFECGCLWGEQLAKVLGWHWIAVRFNDQAPIAIGVASPDASLVIYPIQTIFLYSERLLPIRVARSFAVLTEPGRVPMLPPSGLENVMDHIH